MIMLQILLPFITIVEQQQHCCLNCSATQCPFKKKFLKLRGAVRSGKRGTCCFALARALDSLDGKCDRKAWTCLLSPFLCYRSTLCNKAAQSSSHAASCSVFLQSWRRAAYRQLSGWLALVFIFVGPLVHSSCESSRKGHLRRNSGWSCSWSRSGWTHCTASTCA